MIISEPTSDASPPSRSRSDSPRTSSQSGGKAARTRSLLLTHALDVIAESGEFTGEEVAQRAGVSTATFYAHFATKDHAIEACLERCFTEYAHTMAELESVELLLDVGLWTTLTRIVTSIAAINNDYQALLRLARARIQSSRLLRDQSRREERRAFASTRRFIELGQSAGRIRQGDVEVLTATVRTVLDGLDNWTVRTQPLIASHGIPELLHLFLQPGPTMTSREEIPQP